MSEAKPLAGRVALITGASQGVGRAIALAYADAGAELLLAARGVAALEQVAAEAAARGARAHVLPCDVGDPAQVEAMAAAARERGGAHILVNNAGVAGSHKLIGHPDELWERIIAVNLTAVFRVTRAIAPQMAEHRWGRIITIASIASRVGNRYMAAYTASKHGVLGLVRALAVELNPAGITVNAICPGYVDTPMTDGAIENIVRQTGRSPEQARAALAATSPQGRLIDPDEIAALAVMLAGEAARGITGQAINIDGGAVMS
jgi:NAD(P)-dependent dehydrogenase (short-subunit alcohol dehydrogenase family)